MKYLQRIISNDYMQVFLFALFLLLLGETIINLIIVEESQKNKWITILNQSMMIYAAWCCGSIRASAIAKKSMMILMENLKCFAKDAINDFYKQK